MRLLRQRLARDQLVHAAVRDDRVARIVCLGHPVHEFCPARRAGLNYGDCFSYALAIWRGEPLLFKGGDFVHTDVTMVDMGSR